MQAAEARPPYVTFEVRPVEDRNATLEAGHYVAKDVTYALITPQGSKDRFEREVDDWFVNLQQQVQEGRFDPTWLQRYRDTYKMWKEGQEAPLTGSPVTNWPVLSPSQVKMLQGANVRTIEDMAAANEETLGRLGMGARALKQKAVDWLASANDVGKLAEEVNALRVANADLAARNDKLQLKLEELVEKSETNSKPKRL